MKLCLIKNRTAARSPVEECLFQRIERAWERFRSGSRNEKDRGLTIGIDLTRDEQHSLHLSGAYWVNLRIAPPRRTDHLWLGSANFVLPKPEAVPLLQLISPAEVQLRQDPSPTALLAIPRASHATFLKEGEPVPLGTFQQRLVALTGEFARLLLPDGVETDDATEFFLSQYNVDRRPVAWDVLLAMPWVTKLVTIDPDLSLLAAAVGKEWECLLHPQIESFTFAANELLSLDWWIHLFGLWQASVETTLPPAYGRS